MTLQFIKWLDTDRGRIAICRIDSTEDIPALGAEVVLDALRHNVASVEVSHDRTTIAILPGRDVPQQPF